MKFKKTTDSAPDLGVIESYIDMYSLEQPCENNASVDGAFFIFLTDSQIYTTQPRATGTRAELPMHEGAVISADKIYTVTGATAKKSCDSYPNGFMFKRSRTIDYTSVIAKNKEYWFFIEEF